MVIQLRNCSTLTAANGDELDHTTIGDVMPGAGPAQVGVLRDDDVRRRNGPLLCGGGVGPIQWNGEPGHKHGGVVV